MRSLGYLKLLVETMLVTVDCPKHQVLCCSNSTHCCPPRVSKDEDLLGLAYSEEDLRSVESLNLEGDLNMTGSFVKLKSYQPFVTVNPTLRKDSTKKTVDELCKGLCLVKGGADESDDHPAMFLPGRVLHLEDSTQYAVNQ